MNMDLTFQGQTASEKGSGVVQYHPSAGDVTMNVTSSSGAGGQAEMILADGVIYMKLPSQEMRAFAQEFNNNELATRPWLKLDPNGTDPLDKAFAPVAKTAQVVLWGQIDGQPLEPVAWTNQYGKGRVFYTSLGHQEDFRTPQFVTLMHNAARWALDMRPALLTGKGP